MTPKEELFTQIAREHLGIDTLEERRRDCLDFHDVGVVGVKKALQAAYVAGAADTRKCANELVACLEELMTGHSMKGEEAARKALANFKRLKQAQGLI